MKKHLQNTSSGIEGSVTIGNFCHKPLDPTCVHQGLVDSLVTRYYLYAEMCNGWVERESQYGARRGELESMKVDLTVAADKNVPAPSHWLQQHRFALMNLPFRARGNCIGKSEGREQRGRKQEEKGWACVWLDSLSLNRAVSLKQQRRRLEGLFVISIQCERLLSLPSPKMTSAIC